MNGIGVLMFSIMDIPLVIVASIFLSLFFYRKRDAFNYGKAAFLVFAIDLVLSCLPLIYIKTNVEDLEMMAIIPMIMMIFSVVVSFVVLVINIVVFGKISKESSVNSTNNSESEDDSEKRNKKNVRVVTFYLIWSTLASIGLLLGMMNNVKVRDDIIASNSLFVMFAMLVYVVFANLSKKLYKTPLLFIALSVISAFSIFMSLKPMALAGRDAIMSQVSLVEYLIVLALSLYFNIKDLKYFKNHQQIK
jgi:hypothetical protein